MGQREENRGKWTCAKKEPISHAATVVGDTVGDPFKDTSSVALNPVIKFTTLFGLLAVEIAVTMKNQTAKTGIGVFFFLVALIFVYRSFYLGCGFLKKRKRMARRWAFPKKTETRGKPVRVPEGVETSGKKR